MNIFINIDKIIFINTKVINRRICYSLKVLSDESWAGSKLISVEVRMKLSGRNFFSHFK
jgi:hypothetical protein